MTMTAGRPIPKGSRSTIDEICDIVHKSLIHSRQPVPRRIVEKLNELRQQDRTEQTIFQTKKTAQAGIFTASDIIKAAKRIAKFAATN